MTSRRRIASRRLAVALALILTAVTLVCAASNNTATAHPPAVAQDHRLTAPEPMTSLPQ